MTQSDDKEIQRLLKQVFPSADRELQRDLWPVMLRKLLAPRTALSWFDWTLIVALGSWVFFYPEGILQLLYHL
jgi:hypothetical protein